MKRFFLSVLAVIFLTFAAQAQANQTFTTNELMKIKRVGAPQISPNGKSIIFTVGETNLTLNRVINQIYAVAPNGDHLKSLTGGDNSNSAPRWSPDGQHIAYVSGGQIWLMEADGDNKKRLTEFSTGAGNPVWSPDGRFIAFVSDVYPDCKGNERCNRERDQANESSRVKAVVTNRLLYRHWDEWRDKKRTHLFVVNVENRNITPITSGEFDTPPYAASSFSDYAFSPDSSEIVFLKNTDKVEAVSTNSDIFVVSLNPEAAERNITAENKGYDASPVYTPDGKYLLYRSQMTAGFEADRWRLMRFDRQSGKTIELTKNFDLQVEDFSVAPDSSKIYFTAGDRGKQAIFEMPISGGAPKSLFSNGFASDVRVAPDGGSLIFNHSTASTPNELMRYGLDGSGLSPVTRLNSELMAQFNLRAVEETEWRGALNANIHGFLVKPANFDASKKYPLMVLIHGGPQSAFYDSWGYRWNAQIFANWGYVVFMPNPRGSVSYGQKFVNEISGDWGGKAYTDIMNGVANVIKLPFIDQNRIGAAGASYGGYMVNWILGHNNDPRFRFRALVSHAGVYNMESMAGATEEQWFTNWEFKGTPQTNPAMYERWSPHKFSKNFRTPTLVIHGELDYRVPVGEGLQLYTALHQNNVETRLIYFPDEGHWILKPQNSLFWYQGVRDWFGKYLKP